MSTTLSEGDRAGSNDGVRVMDVPGMGAGLFAMRDFAKGEIVCCELPLLSYELRADCDALAARVSAFLSPHRSVSHGGRWGDNCPGALPYAFQWTLFMAHLSELPEERREYIEREFYAPRIDDGVYGVQSSKTFAEAKTFADFLLGLMSSSYTVFMDLPELADFSEWPSTPEHTECFIM